MPFPFMKLPPEIRIMIYRLVLPIEGRIMVYKKLVDPDRPKKPGCLVERRTTCMALANGCLPRGCPVGMKCYHNSTYTLQSPSYYSGILALNHRVRSEAIPIYYGSNVFLFTDEFIVIPFLVDRTQLSRSHITHIHVEFGLETSHFKRQLEMCKRTLEYFEQHLDLECFTYVISPWPFLSYWPNLKSKSMRWISALVKIVNSTSSRFELYDPVTPQSILKVTTRLVNGRLMARFDKVLEIIWAKKTDTIDSAHNTLLHTSER